jgi:hypothetical protein
MVQDSHERNGIKICASIAVEDFGLWKAYIPSVHQLPTDLRHMQNRALWIQCPSQDAWLKKLTLYHEKRKSSNIDCSATQRADAATELQIKKAPDRQVANHLLLFPDDIVFDNLIFSNHIKDVEMNRIGMEVQVDENVTKNHLAGMVVYWRIAETYRGRKFEDDEEDIDVSTLF